MAGQWLAPKEVLTAVQPPHPGRAPAYLRAVFFNGADTYLSTSQANIPAGAGVWQQLALAPVTVAADGYVAVYVANESPMDVFFDDVEITVERLILQENHYYPFGLNMAGIEREGRPEHDYQYNQGTEGKGFQGQEGKAFRVERERDLGLGWDLTRYRGYDYQLGRFWQVDPKAEVAGQEGLAPYQYSFNNPVRYNDPMGDCPPGKDCTDYLIGMGAAVVDNVLGGITPVRGYAAKYVKDAAAFNMGQDHGDGLSMVAGVAMMDGGGAAASGGALVTVASGGVLGEVGVPAAVAGTAIAAEGVIMTAAGASNLANQKGRLNAHGNSKSDTRSQHGYVIKDTHNNNEIVKVGVSSGEKTSKGGSIRGNSQANLWNKEPGNTGRYEAEVQKDVPAGNGARQEILDWEAQTANANRSTLDPKRHKRP